MKKRMLTLCLALILLSGCTATSSPPPTPMRTDAPAIVMELTQDTTLEPAAIRTPQADRAISSMGLDLLRQSRKEGENTMVSPLSAALCLSMVANGAAGETLEQFLALLGEGCTLSDLNTNVVSLLGEYATLEDTTLEIADSLWLENGFQAERDFLLACQAFYQAQVYSADFAAPEALTAVNDWVKEHTGGMIPTLLEKFPEGTAALLLNAIYMDAKWEKPFAPEDTRPGDFSTASGGQIETDFMHSLGDNLYFATDGEVGVILPYKDGRLGFVAVLPGEDVSLSDYLAGWDGNTLKGFLTAAATGKVSLSIPKFKAEWSGELTDTLRALGLTSAFDSGKSDFSAMGVTAEGEGVFLSKVIQKTAIDVSEQGTKAAAVTGAIMYTGAAPAPVDYVSLILDRPFVYAVVDLERGVPLFLGTYEAP